MLVENHEIVVRLDFLFNHDAWFARIFVRDEFNWIHFVQHFDKSSHVLLSQMLQSRVSYAQSFFVDWEVIDRRFDERLEIVDDKCDNEVVIHMLSQLKEKHVVDAFSCYDVLIFDHKQIRFVRHETTNFVQLIKIDQI